MRREWLREQSRGDQLQQQVISKYIASAGMLLE